MRAIQTLVAGAAMALLLTAGVAQAGSNLNEVGAVLVYPAIVTTDTEFRAFETFVTITNAGAEATNAHLSFVNGRAWIDPCFFLGSQAQPGVNCETMPNPTYCYECDWTIPLSGNDTETIVISGTVAGGITLQIEGDGVGDSVTGQHANEAQMDCEFPYGMLVVTLEDPATGETVTDNVLLGEQVAVDYNRGLAFSIPAVSLQGGAGGDGNRTLSFDDVEFGRLPRIVATDFIAPDPLESAQDSLFADLFLFTLGFDRQQPPAVDCSVTGYDADENPFSRSIRFGCWEFISLGTITPEFEYPNLGQGLEARDTHGWLQLNCRVDPRGNVPPEYTVNGGVHGAIYQEAFERPLRRGTATFGLPKDGPRVSGLAAWGRLLYQSVTTGDAVTLLLEEEGVGAGQCNPLVEDCN